MVFLSASVIRSVLPMGIDSDEDGRFLVAEAQSIHAGRLAVTAARAILAPITVVESPIAFRATATAVRPNQPARAQRLRRCLVFLSLSCFHRESFFPRSRGSSGTFGNRAGSCRSPFRVFTSQVVFPMCPNFPHRGHILPTFRTGLGRKKPARLPRNSVIIICIGGRVDQGPLGCLEGLAVRCANLVASTRYIPSLAFESIPRRHSRIPAHPARLSKKTEPNEGPEPTSLLVRPLS